jgi:hypothetical protein
VIGPNFVKSKATLEKHYRLRHKEATYRSSPREVFMSQVSVRGDFGDKIPALTSCERSDRSDL